MSVFAQDIPFEINCFLLFNCIVILEIIIDGVKTKYMTKYFYTNLTRKYRITDNERYNIHIKYKYSFLVD